MLPKEERKALLLRLFNDETPLVNLTLKQTHATVPKVESGMTEAERVERGRNSSSPEDGAALLDALEAAICDEEQAQTPG
jgi:multisite-specific tRNA:(cytosine-C5)-methyltransferase